MREPHSSGTRGSGLARLGQYQLFEQLGEGGAGTVYRALDTRLGRVVAIKVIRSDLVDHPARRERFQRAALALSRLNHPNICALYDTLRMTRASTTS